MCSVAALSTAAAADDAAVSNDPLPPATSQAAGRSVSFNDQIRPILSDRCYFCHGPDEDHREAGLRLDDREAAIEAAAIVPGEPDASLLIERIAETDEGILMPPPHSNRARLSDEEVELFRRWIAEGAEFERHWAFAPLSDPVVPDVQNEAAVSNPIDRFVLATLERAGIEPSPPADRATLIRRLTLDLTGLLPEPAEIARFEADTRPDAYERRVDALLASPHFGERWGRHWLDQARYADSHGYSVDAQRSMWPYRDWVIRAIGDDMPFDQFTIEQLAGDLLTDATKQQLIASAFHRNTLINQEGGSDPEQFRHESVVDRVNTTGAVWLGLTLGCAQCHTHKYDPITHREYYELFAFFNSGTDVNNTGATVAVARGEALGIPRSPSERQREADQRRRETELLQRLLAQQQQAEDSSEADPWRQVRFRGSRIHEGIEGDAGFQPLEDGSLLVVGDPDPNTSYRITIPAQPLPSQPREQSSAEETAGSRRRIAAMKLRVLSDDALPRRGPGLAGNGNFVLTGVGIRVGEREFRPTAAFADHQQPGYAVTGAIDNDPKTGWAINVGPGSTKVMNTNHEAVFVYDPPLEVPADATLVVQLHHQLNANYLIGRFAIEFSEAVAPGLQPQPDPELIKALRRAPAKRSGNDRKRIVEALRQAYPREQQRFGEPETVNLMVMADLPEPRPTFISVRGDFLRPDREVGELAPGGLAAVSPPLPADPSHTRLDLAKWLVSPENPLTPRVTVNRVWMRYFGRGLVETEEDFGTQGSAPTHPELLDWLASQFHDRHLSMKALHRLIVTSSTYRQSSAYREDLHERDPRNELLARQNRLRVEAEIVRDAALAASGNLDRTIGGPSVHPPQPDGVYSFTQNQKRWVPDRGGNRFRRAMYTEFFRSAPHPLFATFDTPDFQTVCTRRARSNTPLQALTVANDEAFVELARAMAGRVLRETGDRSTAAQLEYAFRLGLSRSPTSAEANILTDYYQSLVAALQQTPAEADALLGPDWPTAVDAAEPNHSAAVSGADHVHRAALVAVCRTIFNVDNFITRE